MTENHPDLAFSEEDRLERGERCKEYSEAFCNIKRILSKRDRGLFGKRLQ